MKILVIVAHPDDEVLGMGGTIKKLTKSNHEIKIVIMATGISARRSTDFKNSSQYNVNKNKKDIVTTLLDEYLITSDKKHEESIPQQLLFTRSRVKIQEGCNQICAYCIIPRVRGREITVPLEKILGQIQEYTDQGCKEVVLTGTQLGSYGYDFDDINLEMMLEQILDKTSIPRIRVSSLQPQEITDSLLSIWYDQRMCRHFHVPLQSGSNSILEIMRRRYTAEKFIETIQRIQEVIPDVGVTTDELVSYKYKKSKRQPLIHRKTICK